MSNLVSMSPNTAEKEGCGKTVQMDELLSHIDEDFLNATMPSKPGEIVSLSKIKEILMFLLSHEDVLAYVEERMNKDKVCLISSNGADELHTIMDDSIEEGELMEMSREKSPGHFILQTKPLSENSSLKSDKNISHMGRNENRESSTRSASSYAYFRDRPSFKSSLRSRYCIPHYSRRSQNERSPVDRKIRDKYRHKGFYSPRKYSPSKILMDKILKRESINRKEFKETKRDERRSHHKSDYKSNDKRSASHPSHGDSQSHKKRLNLDCGDPDSHEKQRSPKKLKSFVTSPKKQRVIKVKIGSNRKSWECTHEDGIAIKTDLSIDKGSPQVQSGQSRSGSIKSDTSKLVSCKPATVQLKASPVSSNKSEDSSNKRASLKVASDLPNIASALEGSPSKITLYKKKKSQSPKCNEHVGKQQAFEQTLPVSICLDGIERSETKKPGDPRTKRKMSPMKCHLTFKSLNWDLSANDKTNEVSENSAESSVMPKKVSPTKSSPTSRFVKSIENANKKRMLEDSAEDSVILETINPKKNKLTSRFVKPMKSSNENRMSDDNAENSVVSETRSPSKNKLTYRFVNSIKNSDKKQIPQIGTESPVAMERVAPKKSSSTFKFAKPPLAANKKQSLDEIRKSSRDLLSPEKPLPVFRLIKTDGSNKASEDAKSSKKMLCSKQLPTSGPVVETIKHKKDILNDVRSAIAKKRMDSESLFFSSSVIESGESENKKETVEHVKSPPTKEKTSPKRTSPMLIEIIGHMEEMEIENFKIKRREIQSRKLQRKTLSPFPFMQSACSEKEPPSRNDAESLNTKETIHPRKASSVILCSAAPGTMGKKRISKDITKISMIQERKSPRKSVPVKRTIMHERTHQPSSPERIFDIKQSSKSIIEKKLDSRKRGNIDTAQHNKVENSGHTEELFIPRTSGVQSIKNDDETSTGHTENAVTKSGPKRHVGEFEWANLTSSSDSSSSEHEDDDDKTLDEQSKILVGTTGNLHESLISNHCNMSMSEVTTKSNESKTDVTAEINEVKGQCESPKDYEKIEMKPCPKKTIDITNSDNENDDNIIINYKSQFPEEKMESPGVKISQKDQHLVPSPNDVVIRPLFEASTTVSDEDCSSFSSEDEPTNSATPIVVAPEKEKCHKENNDIVVKPFSKVFTIVCDEDCSSSSSEDEPTSLSTPILVAPENKKSHKKNSDVSVKPLSEVSATVPDEDCSSFSSEDEPTNSETPIVVAPEKEKCHKENDIVVKPFSKVFTTVSDEDCSSSSSEDEPTSLSTPILVAPENKKSHKKNSDVSVKPLSEVSATVPDEDCSSFSSEDEPTNSATPIVVAPEKEKCHKENNDIVVKPFSKVFTTVSDEDCCSSSSEDEPTSLSTPILVAPENKKSHKKNNDVSVKPLSEVSATVSNEDYSSSSCEHEPANSATVIVVTPEKERSHKENNDSAVKPLSEVSAAVSDENCSNSSSEDEPMNSATQVVVAPEKKKSYKENNDSAVKSLCKASAAVSDGEDCNESSSEDEPANSATPIVVTPEKEKDCKEKDLTWSRDEDRQILLTIKSCGDNQHSYEIISNVIRYRSAEQVERRWKYLKVFLQKRLSESQAAQPQ